MFRPKFCSMLAGLTVLAGGLTANADDSPKPRSYLFFSGRPATSTRPAQFTDNETENRVAAPTSARRYSAALPAVYRGREVRPATVTPVTWGTRYGAGYVYPAPAYVAATPGYYGAATATPMVGYSYGYNYNGAAYSANCYVAAPAPCCPPPRRKKCCLFGLFGGCCNDDPCPPPCCPAPAPVVYYDPCCPPGGVVAPGTVIDQYGPTQAPPANAVPQAPIPMPPADNAAPPQPIEKKGTAPSASRGPQLVIPDGRPEA